MSMSWLLWTHHTMIFFNHQTLTNLTHNRSLGRAKNGATLTLCYQEHIHTAHIN